MDVKRVADLYGQGRSLRQIGAELDLTETTVSDHLRRARVTMRRGGPPADQAPTEQILELLEGCSLLFTRLPRGRHTARPRFINGTALTVNLP